MRSTTHLITAAATLLAALFADGARAQKRGWLDDFDQAVKKARSAKKDLLVEFTGSDWCGACVRLDEQVFSRGEANFAV